MGKIGDLFVKLGLKADEYKKGINEAKKENKSFGQSLKDIQGKAAAIWSAIGSSVTAFGEKLISATNKIGDAWAMGMEKMKSQWTTFVQALSNWDFSNLTSKINEVTNATEVLQNALDYSFEVSNSIKLQRAAMANELEELLIAARDPNKDLKERLAATEEYMRRVKPIYQQEIDLAEELKEAHLGKWLAGSGIADSDASRNDLSRFLVDYGKDKDMAAIASAYVKAKSKLEGMSMLTEKYIPFVGNQKVENEEYKKVKAEMEALARDLENYSQNNGYSVFVGKLAEVYENWRGDEDTVPLVEALINASNAQAALNRETRKVQTTQNTIKAQIDKAAEQIGVDTSWDSSALMKDIDKQSAALDKELEKMFSKDDKEFMSWLDEEYINDQKELEDWLLEETSQFADSLKTEYEKIAGLNQMLEQSFVASFSNGMRALTDFIMGVDGASIEQVLAAFVQPLADTMKQMGEMFIAEGIAVSAFKKSLTNPTALIAAGAALIAVSSLISSGLQKLTSNPAGGGTSASTGASSSVENIEMYEQDITVHVVGEISGDKIVLAGQKTLNKWAR